MQTVTCLNALKSEDGKGHLAFNLTKVLGTRQYLYSPACNSYEWDGIPPASSQPNTESEPGHLHMWEPVSRNAEYPPTKEDSSGLIKASCSLWSDVEASPCVSQCGEVTENSWILKTLHQVTFSSNYLDLYVNQGDKTVGCRYLYAPPSEISGFVDEGFPSHTQIHHDKWEPVVSSLEGDGNWVRHPAAAVS